MAAESQLSSDLSSLRIHRDQPPGASSWRRAMVGLLVLGALAGAAAVAYRKLGPRIYKQPVSVTEVALVSPAQASVQVTSTGYVVPQSWSRVGAKIPGRLSRVLVKEGDVVKTGDVIAVLESAEQKSAIAAAQSRVAVARAGASTARANLAELSQRVERVRPLVRASAMPATELQDLEARHKVLVETVSASDAQARAAEAEVQTLKVALADHIIAAPIDGTVIGKPAMVGETVGPQQSGIANVAEIADFSSIVVEIDVPEARVGLIKIGGPAEIVLDAYPTRRYRGTAVDLGKRVNRAKGTVVVKVKFKDTLEGVLPDMSARVSFLTEELKAETLAQAPKKVVAAEAIVHGNGAKSVFVVEDGKLRAVNVTVGPAGSVAAGSVELLDGPPVGARIVRNPSPDNFDGQRIKEQQ
jgi:RND family efflux transporter MFP subunit